MFVDVNILDRNSPSSRVGNLLRSRLRLAAAQVFPQRSRLALAPGLRFGRRTRRQVRHYSATSSVQTVKPDRIDGPNTVEIATSVASRPRAIRMRPIRGMLCRASNVYQRPPR